MSGSRGPGGYSLTRGLTITRASSPGLLEEGEEQVPYFIEGLIDQTVLKDDSVRAFNKVCNNNVSKIRATM